MKDFNETAMQALEWANRYLEKGYEGPVQSQLAPGEIASQIPDLPPPDGEPLSRLVEDFQKLILPGLVHWNDPRFVAYFPCSNSKASVLAELLSSTVNVNAMSWSSSPAATELELKMMRWLGELIGLDWPGVTQDTASTGTLAALLAAREAKFSVNQEGFQSAPRLAIYASTEAHSSVVKGLRIAGFGDRNFRLIEVDENRAMKVSALRKALEEDRKNAVVPCCIVATVGTTSTTAVDPVSEIAKLGREFGAWVHVDAALAGSAALLPEMKWLMDGVSETDSFLFNPHKWLFTGFDCSAFFCKHPEKIKAALAINPEYLKTPFDNHTENMRDWSIQLGRPLRGLKLWFVLRAFGVKGLQEKLREHLQMAKVLATKIRSSKWLRLLEEPRINTVCFSMDSNEKTQKLLDILNASGEIYLSHSKVGERLVLRAAFGQNLSSLKTVDALFALIESRAEKLS